MAFLCLAIENIGDTSYLSGRGMVYFMLIAMCLSQHEQKERLTRRRQQHQEIQSRYDEPSL